MKEKFIDYTHNGDLLEAYCAYPDDAVLSDTYPLVLVSHAWAGRDDFAIDTARTLAENGYVGFALDLYGKNKIGKTVEEKSSMMQPFMQNRKFLHERLLCNLDHAKNLDFVDENKVAAIGFCFGGLCVLDLARIGADLQGVVSFHGLLSVPEGIEYGEINSKVLVLHGVDDPMVKFSEVESFTKEMDTHKANWQINIYGNTKHGFSVPSANDEKLGIVYNSQSEKRAWSETYSFLDEIFL